MKTIFWLVASTFLAVPAYAQVGGISPAGQCNIGNAENIGQHIIDWLLCGASFANPQSTLFGALSLVINVAALSISVYMFLWNSLKWIYFTTQHGVPGGNNGGKIHGGIVILRTGMLLSLLAPVVGNGFSPIQVAMRNFTEIGKDIGDMAANTTANYVAVEGALVNVDLQGIESVTTQIIASEMCAKLFDAHHYADISSGLIPAGTQSVIVETTSNKSDLSINWSYKNPTSVKEGILTNDVSRGICGSIELDLPEILSDNDEVYFNYDSSSDTLSIDSPPNLKPYGDVVVAQYRALKMHIQRIHGALENSTADITMGVALASAKSLGDGSLTDAIDAGYLKETALESTISSNIPTYISNLIAANADYRNQILAAGKDAAKTVNLTDNVVSPDCGLKESFSSALDDEAEDIEICTPNESWQSQLERQGFAALGLYYIVHLKINQKIIDLQAHFLKPNNVIPFYEDFDNFLVNDVYHAIATSEASKNIYSRYSTIVTQFNQKVDQTAFRMNFSAVENVGFTPAETTNNPILAFFKSGPDSPSATLLRAMSGIVTDASGQGDLILKMMSLGSILLGMANVIAGIVFGVAAIALVVKLTPLGKAASFLKGKAGATGGGDDNSSDGADSNSSLSSSLWYLFLATFVIGGLLFIGLPALPLFKWILEIQSWAIMMFMAFIYSPLWIMSHSSITDDRFMAEHTQSGYGMIYELLLRPLLMVIAFYAMIKLMHIADLGFVMMTSYLIGVGGTGISGLGIIIMFGVAIFTAVQLSFRCFDLISLLPDYVVARLGFGTKPLGDVANDNAHKSTMIAAFRTGTGAVSNMASKSLSGAANALNLTASKQGLDKPKS